MTSSDGFLRRTTPRTYRNRRAAGRALADELSAYRDTPGGLVLGLARGGVPVGWEVAAGLRLPLDVFLVRKLGAPDWPELAMGALASGGLVVRNDAVLTRLHISDAALQTVIERETVELHRRERVYRGDRPAAELTGRTVILADDGIATGASMRAAVRAVRSAGAATIVVAVPVGSVSACRTLRTEADAVVCATTPTDFDAVGQAYLDFRQVSDREVIALLAEPTVAD